MLDVGCLASALFECLGGRCVLMGETTENFKIKDAS